MKISKRDRFLALPMSDKLRFGVNTLDRDKSSHWSFLKAKSSTVILDDLLENKPVTTINGFRYKTTRIENFFIGFYRILGAISFENQTKTSEDGKYQIYRLKDDNEVKALAKELQLLIIQANEA